MKPGFSKNVQFLSKRDSLKSHDCLANHIVYPTANCLFFGPWVCPSLLSRKTHAARAARAPSPIGGRASWAPPSSTSWAPPSWRGGGREEGGSLCPLESNSACDKSSHLAPKIEGSSPPDFSIHLPQVLSALPEVMLCCKHRRKYLTGLSRRFIASQSDYTSFPKAYTPRTRSVRLDHGDLPRAQEAPMLYQHTFSP